MILSSLSQSSRYAALHPLFQRAFDHIRDTDLYAMAPGRYNLVGEDLIAIVEQVPAKTKEMARLEAHRRYIDIQLVLEGDETMGWKPLSDCLNPISEHDDAKDIRFFHDAPASWIAVPPDHFCIFFPEDAHAPLVASGSRCDTLLAKPADCGNNGQATHIASKAAHDPHGGLIRKVIFKIALE